MMIDESGAQVAETTDGEQGAAYWRSRAVAAEARADQADAEAARQRRRAQLAKLAVLSVLDGA